MQHHPVQTLPNLSGEPLSGAFPDSSSRHAGKARSPSAFVLKLCLFAATLAAGIHLYFARVLDGDWIHVKFSALPAPSLIIGSSRGLQGIQPLAFIESGLEFQRPLYNFCFNGAAKFGPAYYRHVMAKVKPGTRNGLFLIEVCPMLLADKSANAHADASTFAEPETFIVSQVNQPGRINYDYLLRHFDESYYRPLYMKLFGNRGKLKMGPDGWLDVNVKPMDSASHAKRVAARVQGYKNDYFRGEEFSPLRLGYLKRLAAELGQSGRVVLVRTPVAPEMFRAEGEFFPIFDSLMVSLSDELSIRYLNFAQSGLRDSTTDGSHLYSRSSQILSHWMVDSLTTEARHASADWRPRPRPAEE